MINHALCQRRWRTCRNGQQRANQWNGFLSKPHRLIFANNPTDPEGEKDKEEKEKKKEKVKVTAENARNTLLDLAKENKIDSPTLAKALSILERGSDEDKTKLREFIQKGTDGTLNAGEFGTFLGEAEKRASTEKKSAEKEPKKEDENDLVSGVKGKIFGKTEESVMQTDRMARDLEGKGTEEDRKKAERLKTISSDFKKLNEDDKVAVQAVEKKVAKMVDDKQISKEKANQLLQLDFTNDNWKDRWAELTKDITDPKAKVALDDLQKLKKKEAETEEKAEKDYEEKMQEVRRIVNEMSDKVLEKANKEKSLEVLNKAAGFPVKAGQILNYDQLEGDLSRTPLALKRRPATIKDVRFEEFEVKDENGNVIKKLNPDSPVIIIESYDATTGKMTENKWSIGQFLNWVDNNDATENINSLSELEKSIGQKLKEGESFEYREIFNVDLPNYGAKDHTVKIKKINEAKGEIELDEKVLVNPTGNVRSQVLTLGQFSKWFKRNEVERPIENLEKLRTELRGYNEAQNIQGNRDPSHYPAIEAKKGEILKFDDELDKTFVIKEATDKQITFDNGDKFTLAAFLRWVKKRGVIKKDPHAEGEKAAAPIKDEEEKKAMRDERTQQVEKENAERFNDGKGIPDGWVVPHAEDGSKYQIGYLRKLWDNTTFMSLGDFWEMGNTLVEWIKRKWKRWKHGRVGTVGQYMFGGISTELGGEFKSMYKHAENEEVNHHVEHYKNMDIDFVKHELIAAPNKDILKAAMTALAEKGQLRFDDPGLWASINRLSHGIPCVVGSKPSNLEEMEKVCDSWWGKDTFRELRNKQDSSFNSIKSNFKDNAERLEGDPYKNGGLKAALQILLHKHLNGEYVNPSEYEEYLHYAIEAGKLGFEDKLYFLVMGIGADPHVGHHGLPLLAVDRNSKLESGLLRNFPILDFFASKRDFPLVDSEGRPLAATDAQGNIIYDEVTKKPKQATGNADLNSFKQWIRQYIQKDVGGSFSGIGSYKDFKPGTHFTQFINEVALRDERFNQRLNKAVSSSDNWDHDDMDKWAPRLGEEIVEQLTKQQGGAKQNTTVEGLKNCYLGFNDFTKLNLDMLSRHLTKGTDEYSTKEAEVDIRYLVNGLRSFVRFDSILDRRYDHNGNRSRLGEQELSQNAVNDSSRQVKFHVEEMRRFIKSLAHEMGLSAKAEIVFKNFGFKPSNEDSKLQENAIGEFGKMLEGEMKRKKPEELLAIFTKIQDANKKDGWEVKGIGRKPENKVAEQVEKASTELRPYEHKDIEAKVDTIKRLRAKLAAVVPKTPAERRSQNDDRIEQIITEVDSRNFTQPQEKDLDILEDKINELTTELKSKEVTKEAPAEGAAGVGTPGTQKPA